MRRSGAIVLGLAASAVLVTAGCGSSSDDVTADPTTTGAAGQSSAQSSVTGAPGTPAPGGGSTTQPLPLPTEQFQPGISAAPLDGENPTPPTAVPAPGDAGLPAEVTTEPQASYYATLQQNGIDLSGLPPELQGALVSLSTVTCEALARGEDPQRLADGATYFAQAITSTGRATLDPQRFGALFVSIAQQPGNC